MATTPKLRIETRTITPKLAKRWMDNNHDNRRQRATTVARYAEDMAAGEWHLTGEPIKFNCDGTLIDGQHRLAACIAADTPFESVVIRGVAKEARAAMDSGAPRSFADVLQWKGYPNARDLAASIRACRTYDMDPDAFLSRSTAPSTNAQSLRWLDENPAIVESVEVACAVRPRIALGIHTRMVALIHFQAFGLEHYAEEFFILFRDGGYEAGSAVGALRHWCERQMSNRGPKAETYVFLAMAIKAFNRHVLGEDVARLAFRTGEAFPIILTADALA